MLHLIGPDQYSETAWPFLSTMRNGFSVQVYVLYSNTHLFMIPAHSEVALPR